MTSLFSLKIRPRLSEPIRDPDLNSRWRPLKIKNIDSHSSELFRIGGYRGESCRQFGGDIVSVSLKINGEAVAIQFETPQDFQGEHGKSPETKDPALLFGDIQGSSEVSPTHESRPPTVYLDPFNQVIAESSKSPEPVNLEEPASDLIHE
jgi:hypothetical protein